MSKKNKNKILYVLIVLVLAFLAIVLYLYNQIFIPKSGFPVGESFRIDQNQTGAEIFSNLEKDKFVSDDIWLKVLAKVLNKQRFFRGEYTFDQPVSAYDVFKKITTRPISLAVLIPEGFTKKQVADRLSNYIKNFNKKDFLEKAQEGYLFPDTYYFFNFSTNEEIIKEFTDKFNKTVFESFGQMPSKEQVIIASMIEREAKNPEDMKVISGIIQNRLKKNMPLQIDATVQYGNGFWKDRVMYSDLKKEHDYNTYTNIGLPVGPISNPGLNALKAAIYPTKTDYIYYLTGRDGKMYYAVTHEEHIKNKIKYLLN